MSIINDALKKAEKEKNTSAKPDESLSRGRTLSQIVTKPQLNLSPRNYRIGWVILGLGGILGLTYLVNPTIFLRQKPAPVQEVSKAQAEPMLEPAPEPLPPQENKVEITPFPDFTVSGIIYGEGEPWAIIDGDLLKEGDIIKGTKVVKIDKDRVKLVFEGKEFTLSLQQ